jgi:hypothetical protein
MVALLLSLVTVSPARAGTEFAGVRLVVGRHGQLAHPRPGLDEKKGTMTVDSEARRLRFEAPGRPVLDVALDAVTAMNFEESSFPHRLFGRRNLYLTVHYVGVGGGHEIAIFSLPSDSAEQCLVEIARSSPQPVQRHPSTTSFVGLPVHVGVADTVYVTGTDGLKTKGTVTEVSLSEIALGAQGRFDEASVSLIEVNDSIADGILQGALLSLIPAFLVSYRSCIERCDIIGFLTPAGWGIVAGGAFVGGLIDKGVMRRAYRRSAGASTMSLQWTPVLGRGRAGVEVRLVF